MSDERCQTADVESREVGEAETGQRRSREGFGGCHSSVISRE
jgi:hypothetical protein